MLEKIFECRHHHLGKKKELSKWRISGKCDKTLEREVLMECKHEGCEYTDKKWVTVSESSNNKKVWHKGIISEDKNIEEYESKYWIEYIERLFSQDLALLYINENEVSPSYVSLKRESPIDDISVKIVISEKVHPIESVKFVDKENERIIESDNCSFDRCVKSRGTVYEGKLDGHTITSS